MTQTLLHDPSLSTPQTQQIGSKAQDRIRRLVWKLSIATLLLMAVGSATRVMNAGLACPDWPLCYGKLVPTAQMNLQVFLEWFHRLDAAGIGLGAIALVGLSWWDRRDLPKWLPWAALFALALIIFQGVLGGLTVTQLLRFDIVTAHLGTALLFFTILLIIGCLLLPYQGAAGVGKLPEISLTAAILVYLQSILGALVGFILGTLWYTLFHTSGYDSLLYFDELRSNKVVCSRPAKQSFKCSVYKNGQLVSSNIV